jgi:hypothetical protein
MLPWGFAKYAYDGLPGVKTPQPTLEWLPGGEAVLSYPAGRNGVRRFEDLHGAPVEVKTDDRLGTAWLGDEEAPRLRSPWFIQKTNTSWPTRIRSFREDRTAAFWYSIADKGLFGATYFEGYDAKSGEQIGYLGKSGFLASQPTEQDCFHPRTVTLRSGSSWGDSIPRASYTGDGAAMLYLVDDDHRCYEIDLHLRKVRALFHDLVALSSNHTWGRATPTELVVRTTNEVLLIDERSQIKRRYTIPTELVGVGFEWAEIAPGSAVAKAWSRRQGDVFWFNSAGEVTRRESQSVNPLKVYWPGYLELSMSVPAPLFVAMAALTLEFAFYDDWTKPLTRWARTFSAPVAATLAISLLSAIACYWRQTRYAASRRERIVWPLFVLAMGPLGWIGYRFGRTWPMLDKCPHCDRTIPRDGALCPCCHHEMPRPAPIGLELVTA